MAKISNTKLNSASGEQYPFDVYSWDTMFNEGAAGVFFIARRYKLSDGQFTLDPIFIGETSDLSLIYGYHPKQKCWMEHGANVRCIYLIKDPARRQWVKQDLIDYHEPYCND